MEKLPVGNLSDRIQISRRVGSESCHQEHFRLHGRLQCGCQCNKISVKHMQDGFFHIGSPLNFESLSGPNIELYSWWGHVCMYWFSDIYICWPNCGLLIYLHAWKFYSCLCLSSSDGYSWISIRAILNNKQSHWPVTLHLRFTIRQSS